MNQEEIINKLAQVASLPRDKYKLLTDTHSVKYGVMMTYPHFSIMREKEQHDLYFTLDPEEAQDFCEAKRLENELCEFEVFALSRTFVV